MGSVAASTSTSTTTAPCDFRPAGVMRLAALAWRGIRSPGAAHGGGDDPIGCAPARSSACQIWRFRFLRPIQIRAAVPRQLPR